MMPFGVTTSQRPSCRLICSTRPRPGNGAPSGFRLLSTSKNITIEDCKVYGNKDGFTVGDPNYTISDVDIRRFARFQIGQE